MRALAWIGILFVGFVSGGATCARRDAAMMYPPPPPALNETPTVDELAAVLNRTDAIQQLATNSASIDVLSMPRVPKLSATINLAREKQFRMQASLPLLFGAGLDLGSNDRLFWFEVPEATSKTLYYANHQAFRQQLERSILPVDPTWLMEALGLTHLDPSSVVSGPTPAPDGTLELRTLVSMPNGNYQRVWFVQSPGGYVKRQLLYAPDGRLVASADATRHRFYDAYECALPHRVTIELKPAAGPPLSMRIDVGDYLLNQLLSDDPQLFAMPRDAAQAFDLTQLSLTPPPPADQVHYSANRAAALPFRGSSSAGGTVR